MITMMMSPSVEMLCIKFTFLSVKNGGPRWEISRFYWVYEGVFVCSGHTFSSLCPSANLRLWMITVAV